MALVQVSPELSSETASGKLSWSKIFSPSPFWQHFFNLQNGTDPVYCTVPQAAELTQLRSWERLATVLLEFLEARDLFHHYFHSLQWLVILQWKAAVNTHEIISGFEGAIWGLWADAAKMIVQSFSHEENKENAQKFLLLNNWRWKTIAGVISDRTMICVSISNSVYIFFLRHLKNSDFLMWWNKFVQLIGHGRKGERK